MNELEKTPSPEQSATPTPENITPEVNPTEAADAAENNETPQPEAEVKAEEEQSEAIAQEAEETARATAALSCAEEDAPDAESEKSWHDMSKQELVDALAEIVEKADMQAHREVNSIKQAFHALRTRELDKEMSDFLDAGNSPDAFAAHPDPLEFQFKDLYTRFKEARAEFLNAEEARLNENLVAKRAVIENIKNIVEDIDNINLHFPRFQELQGQFKEIKEIPQSAETEIWKEYQQVVELFYDRLKMNKELRDLDFRKNLEAKRELIERARALADEKDVIAAFRTLQELHKQWREIGPVAKEYRESIWAEFSAESSAVNKRHQQYFENRKQQEQANEEAKTKLCEEIEALDFSALDSFNKWEAMTKQVLELQARWKEIGFASKKVNNQLFARFRKVCDDFFTAKAEYYKRVKEELADNLVKKTELCEKAEALLENGDPTRDADKVIALQAEWKTIGGVARRHSDEIWQRFTTACNKFFQSRKEQVSATRKEQTDNLNAKRALIEELKAVDPAENGALQAVRALQAKWQEIGHVPYRVKDKIFQEYRAECDRIYNSLSAGNKRRRMSQFEGHIENLSGDGKLSRERERLYRTYEQKRAEIKTYENNLGFFKVKSTGGNSMVQEMERRVENLRKDLDELKHKIELIDEKIESNDNNTENKD